MSMGEDLKAAAENLGDVKSDARGSGARYISGKPDLSLIPVGIQKAMLRDKIGRPELRASLDFLDQFQRTGSLAEIHAALRMVEGWMDEAAHVLTYGTKKYAAWNWAKGMSWSACIGCAMRHVEKIARGQEIDDESGRHHMGHYVCNLIFLAHYAEYYREGNDLPSPGLFADSDAPPTAAEIERLAATIPTVCPTARAGGCDPSECDPDCPGAIKAGGTD